MDVTITEFRRDLFTLVESALNGAQVRVTHKGRRVRIVPEEKGTSRLDRVTRGDYINPQVSEVEARKRIRDEMAKAWDKDWKDL